jgi:aerobic carbon-monoxide dehydrogenase medium subunit
MKAAAFDYLRPRDLNEAVHRLAQVDGYVKLIAGGQSLGPMLNLRLVRPSLLVDVSRLASVRHRGSR